MAKKKYFSNATPDSERSGRQSNTRSSAPRFGQPNYSGMTAAQFRLYVWSGLPERHRNEACRQIRRRCKTFISSIRVGSGERKPEIDRLVSEVVAHLLRATVCRGETPMDCKLQAIEGDEPDQASTTSQPLAPWIANGFANEHDPAQDARLTWIVEESCNWQALFHRYEDVRRRDRGGKWGGSSYPLIAVDDKTIEQLSGHYDPTEDETDSLQAEDSRRAWDGLLQLAAHQFGPDDDVVALLQVLAHDHDTQESFGSHWPIAKIVRALNGRQPHALWNSDRVDNAKRRLTKFIARLKHDNGLDAVDLRALLARYARERYLVAETSDVNFAAYERAEGRND
jgi:hypothetical protein